MVTVSMGITVWRSMRKLSRTSAELELWHPTKRLPPLVCHPNPSRLQWRVWFLAAAGSGRSEHWNVDTLIPPRATARKLLLSQRSLRTQDRSRGATPATQPHRDSTPTTTQPHGRTRNTATHPKLTRSPRQTALTHDASEPLRVLYRK